MALPDETAAELAVARTRDSLLGSIGLLGARIGATAVTIDGEISAIAVAILAAVVAGEQLWHRRDRIPRHTPAPLAQAEHVTGSDFGWYQPLIIAAAFGAFVALGALFGRASAALLGFPAGFVLRDLVMAIRVARWQSRHHRILAWIDDANGVTPRALPPT